MKITLKTSERSLEKTHFGRAAGLMAVSFVVVALFAMVAVAPAQAAEESVDEQFNQARQLAFSGQRLEARTLCAQILEEHPGNADVRLLLGRVLAWDKEYEEARAHFRTVIAEHPGYLDARVALADVELWADQPDAALAVVEQGLSRKATHEGLLYKKAMALNKMGESGEAAEVLNELIDINPGHTDGWNLLRSIQKKNQRTAIAMKYGFERVDAFSDDWHFGSFQIKQRTGIGTVIASVNLANRFQKARLQYELTAYPKLAKGFYAYMNYGYADKGLFPRHRAGLEFYKSLGKGFEMSAGARYLEFDSSTVRIYTGSIGKYFGNYWISVRPYFTPKTVGTSRSWNVSMRRYLGGADSWLGVTGGLGSKPDDDFTTLELARLDSWKARVEGYHPVGFGVAMRWSVGYSWEEFLGGRERKHVTGGLGFEHRF